jgi:hypothetical protein
MRMILKKPDSRPPLRVEILNTFRRKLSSDADCSTVDAAPQILRSARTPSYRGIGYANNSTSDKFADPAIP